MSEIKITGEDLISKAKEIIQNLIDTGAKSWSLHIPARINEDPDLVLSRVVTEYETTIENLEICQYLYKQEFDSHGVTRKELKELQDELLKVSRSALMSLCALSPLIKKHIEASKRRKGE